MVRDRSQPPNGSNRPAPLEMPDHGGSAAGRSRREPSLQDNRERLGVKADHKTETMRKRHRGTFP